MERRNDIDSLHRRILGHCLLQPPRDWRFSDESSRAMTPVHLPPACPPCPGKGCHLPRCQQSLLVIVAPSSVPRLLLLKWAETPVLWQYMHARLRRAVAPSENMWNKASISMSLWVIVAQFEIPAVLTSLVITLTSLRSARPAWLTPARRGVLFTRTPRHTRSLGPDAATTSTMTKNSNNIRLIRQVILNLQIKQINTMDKVIIAEPHGVM